MRKAISADAITPTQGRVAGAGRIKPIVAPSRGWLAADGRLVYSA